MYKIKINSVKKTGGFHKWAHSFGKQGDDKWFFRGLELLFTENDAGSFEEYRCPRSLTDGKPFSILVEGIASKISIRHALNLYN